MLTLQLLFEQLTNTDLSDLTKIDELLLWSATLPPEVRTNPRG
jgi:hypothetical protein